MKTSLRKVKATLILGMLLMSVIPFLSNYTTAQETKSRAISFNTYLNLSYDASGLNQPLQIDRAVSVPITVYIWTEIPELPIMATLFPLKWLFLFGKPIGPNAQIHLEIVNPPDWATIYFSTTDLLINYPMQNDGKKSIQTSLIISPKYEAPAEAQELKIKLSLPTIKRVNGYSTTVSIPFTPSFNPTIQINVVNPIRTVGPHESVTFTISIQNVGNKITRVTPTIVGGDTSWTPTINPPQVEIPPTQQSTFSFSLITPYNFGWHNEYGRFQVNFVSQIYPFQPDSPSSNQTIFLVLNNHGFSTPGFEFIIFLVALIGLSVLIRIRHKKNS